MKNKIIIRFTVAKVGGGGGGGGGGSYNNIVFQAYIIRVFSQSNKNIQA
jgi:hypothetical protein